MPDDNGPNPGQASSGGTGNLDPQNEAALNLIRQKIHSLYDEEPDAAEEVKEAEQHTHPGSKHQRFIAELNASGKSLAEIQAAWHEYYNKLSDPEKYVVWQEFYQQSNPAPTVQHHAQMGHTHEHLGPVQPQPQTQAQALGWGSQAAQASQTPHPGGATVNPIYGQMGPAQQGGTVPLPAPAGALPLQKGPEPLERLTRRNRHLKKAAEKLQNTAAGETVSDIKKRVTGKVEASATAQKSKRAYSKHKHHVHSLVFGIACGLIVVFVFLFSFFNEYIIAPFIQPSRKAIETPVIVDVATYKPSGGPKVIIPKINLEIPVDYTQTTTNEKAIELALDNGVVHYPTTVKPGEAGNAAFFGHSSNNIFNPGKYKFAFVLLKELVEGDTFYLTRDDKTYVYKVFSKRVVPPSEVSVLDPIAGKTATATLITCDPPGTSINRLVVVGEQISPDPLQNTAPNTPKVETAVDAGLPGNGPTLWARIWSSIF